MKAKLLAAVLVCFVGVSQASASIIEVDFTGFAGGTRPTEDAAGNYNPGFFGGKLFTAQFVFDTDKGTLQTVSPDNYRLDGGLVSAFIDLGDLGLWGSGHNYFGGPNWNWNGFGSFLTWNSDLSSVFAYTGDSCTYCYIGISNAPLSNERYGFFQFGLCPTVVGGPCGTVMSAELTAFSVPSPIVGAGFPGLLLGGILFIWRRFRPAVSLQDVT